MLGRLAAVAAMAALMGCAGMEPAGRNASRAPQASPPPAATSAPAPTASYTPPPAVASAPLPAAPAVATPAPAPARAAAAVTAPPPAAVTPAPVAAPTPAPAATEPPRVNVNTRASGDDVVVPAERERQVPVPAGDPRSVSERMEDINAWDRCVTHVQSAYERDPMRPQLQSPEEYCSGSLGMANRNAVPVSRTERRR